MLLEIIVDGTKLHIPKDIQLNVIIDSPLFVADKFPVPFSLTFDVDKTPTNLKTFNYPNRATSFKHKEYKASVFFTSLSILNGLITISKVAERISLNFKGVEIFEGFKKNLNEVELPSFNLGKLYYETQEIEGENVLVPLIDRNDPNNLAGKYRNLFNNSIAPGSAMPFYTAPIKIADQDDWTYRIEPDILPSNTADNWYINFFNSLDLDFNMTGNWQYISDYWNSGGFLNTRCFPFPYVGKFIETFFGNLIVSHPFSSGELAKLVFITSFHPNWYKQEGYFQNIDTRGMLFDDNLPPQSTGDYFVSINKYMPDVTVIESLKQVLKLFCCSLIPISGKFKVVKNKDVLSSSLNENWTEKLVGNYEISNRDKQTYKYAYEDIEDEDIRGLEISSVFSIQNLIDEVVAEHEGIKYYQIASTGEVYSKENNDNQYKYKRYVSGYGGIAPSGDNVFDISVGISPLAMGVHKTFDRIGAHHQVVPTLYDWYVPELNDSRTSRPSNLKIMFARGMINVPSKTNKYPFLSATNINIDGDNIGDYSLQWGGEYGLIENFHKEFKEWIEKDKTRLSGVFLLSAIDFKNLDVVKKKHVSGKNFLIEKIQVTITANQINPAIVDLIEA